MISYILAVLTAGLFLAADRYTKAIFEPFMNTGKSMDFIKGFIDFTVISNEGGAWGMLSGHTWILLSVTLVVMLVLITLLLKFGVKNKLIFWSVCLILSGGIGNMIDRIFNDGKVIDFLHFEFWPTFPVFNVADCAIVIGSCLLVLYFIMDTAKETKAKRNSAKAPSNNNGEN